MTDKENALHAWKVKAGGQSALAGRHNYMIGIDDYKQALKKEIEEKHKNLKVYGNIPNGWKAEAYKEILQLLDTVKPIL